MTAEREQPAEPDDVSVSGLCEVGADRVTCIVADPAHRRIYHGGSPLGDVATTLLAAKPEPDVLDLVRQYGTAAQGLGYSEGVGQRTDIDAKTSAALFARIEAEVNRLRAERDDATSAVTIQRLAFAMPQQPVQARNFAGHPWWIHGCGTAWAASGTPRVKCPGCDHNDKPWRPLLLGEVMREPRTWPQLVDAPAALPPIEATQPCFRCGRTGPLVVDRFPQQPHLRDHPERFMHACGICPQEPTATGGGERS